MSDREQIRWRSTPRPVTEAEEAAIADAYRAGIRVHEIQASVRRPSGTVCTVINRLISRGEIVRRNQPRGIHLGKTCQLCNREIWAAGLCGAHYQRARANALNA